MVVPSNVGWAKPLQGAGQMTLKPGEELSFPLTIMGLPQLTPNSNNVEQYSFELVADPLNGVVESDESNNTLLMTVDLDQNCVGHPGQ
jgi:hypothetical protein